jgi:hypothetical protein
MHKMKQKARWYKHRYIQLFDPVYWIGRDHCRMENAPRTKLRPGFYLLRWKHQRYIDSNGYEKSSIIPTWKIFLFS